MLNKDFRFPRWIAIFAQMLSIIVAASEEKWTIVCIQLTMLFVAESTLWYARKRLAEEEKKSAAALQLYREEAISFVNNYFSKNAFVKSELCLSCGYFHGRSGIVCALHPEGHDGDDCIDFEAKR